jgi:hypothetical protein
VASQVIMDDGAEPAMARHQRAGRRIGMPGVDDEYLFGQHCPGRHRAAHQGTRKAPGERGRVSQREDAAAQPGETARPTRMTRRGKRD